MSKISFKFLFSIHFVAIVALLASMLYPLTWPFANPRAFWIQNIAEHLMLGILYFVNIFFFFPRLFNKGRVVLYVLTLIAAVCLLVFGNAWVGQLMYVDEAYIKAWSTPGHPYKPDHHWENKWAVFLSVMFLALSNIAAFAQKQQADRLAYQTSEKERVSAELSFLKAQINPHFFFNTLHTIYSLTDTNLPSAKESIYTLSHMMRYVIYDTKHDYTFLSKEIGFLEDYIKLMKMRLPESVQVIFDKQILATDVKIAPMLLLPFVENAFKHGIRLTQPSYVYIGIQQKEQSIIFEVKNSLFNSNSSGLEEGSGIGVANTQRRLELLYTGRYELDIEQNDAIGEYSVTLKLNTHEN